ncbi:MAG: DUF1624 domain-containing protein [Candidatus Aenigmarchaeota archaeon]|nr:DUF1624 domain-containing protein [Candidatus Aenigmarchaeota archaeon]
MNRFWEIDATRGIAVVLMVFFNYSFTLDYLRIYTITEVWGFWWLFPRLVAGAFILLAGISVTISYSRDSRIRKHLMRGIKIFGLGLLITAATYLLIPSATVWFGILHLIGTAIIISLLFMKWNPKLLITAGIFAIILGALLESTAFGFPWLLWLGLMPYSFTTLDYFPLLPWLGVFMIGMAIGKLYYREGKRQFKIKELRTGTIGFLGRHSLIIYLLHLPVLLVVLKILGLLL